MFAKNETIIYYLSSSLCMKLLSLLNLALVFLFESERVMLYTISPKFRVLLHQNV